jgi:hypothetical protein
MTSLLRAGKEIRTYWRNLLALYTAAAVTEITATLSTRD